MHPSSRAWTREAGLRVATHGRSNVREKDRQKPDHEDGRTESDDDDDDDLLSKAENCEEAYDGSCSLLAASQSGKKE